MQILSGFFLSARVSWRGIAELSFFFAFEHVIGVFSYTGGKKDKEEYTS